MKELKLDIVFSQNDQKWKLVLLGNNTQANFSIGNFGCKLSCFATYLKAIGIDVDPLSLNEKLKQNDQFPKGSGELADSSIPNVFTNIKIYYASQKYEGTVPDSVFTKAKQLLDSGYLLFAEIDFYPSTVNEDMHFVNIYGYDDAGQFLIADPWTGKKAPLSIYGDPARVVYRIWCYDIKLPENKPQVTLDGPTFEKLVSNSTTRDEVVKQLALPDDATQDTVLRSVRGLQGMVTSSQSTINGLQQEVKNREEQVVRIQQSLEESAKREAALQTALAEGDQSKVALIQQLQGNIKTLGEQVDTISKEKGRALLDLAACKSGQPSMNELQKLIQYIQGLFKK